MVVLQAEHGDGFPVQVVHEELHKSHVTVESF
jgi:hypothetical protein